jgi:hypothetical protein
MIQHTYRYEYKSLRVDGKNGGGVGGRMKKTTNSSKK